MIKTTVDLARFISISLKSQSTVRIFGDVLYYCWDLPKKEQGLAILDFAKRHGWEVNVHEPWKIGLIAEFSPAAEIGSS
jgi:hypothetical protein